MPTKATRNKLSFVGTHTLVINYILVFLEKAREQMETCLKIQD